MAAAAAAQAAALLNTIEKLHSTADKQLETMYKAVSKLKDVDYHKFSTQLHRSAYAYGWADEILTFATPALTPAQIVAADALGTVPAIKAKLDRRNAFLVIMAGTDGHPVENLLEAIAPGNPRLVFDTVHAYFHPGTTAGLQNAYITFFTTTMAISGNTIVEWVATVSRNAKIVRDSGGSADTTAEISVLLKGLLPEFESMRLHLNQTTGLTLAVAVRKLMDHALDKNLLDLCKGGKGKSGNNVFFASESQSGNESPECRNWKQFRCTFGSRCNFKHVGKGGNAADQHPHAPGSRKHAEGEAASKREVKKAKAGEDTANAAATQQHKQQAAAACHFCLDAHDAKDCPAVSSTGVNYSYLVGATTSEPSYAVDASPSAPFVWTWSTFFMLISGLLISIIMLPVSLVKSMFNNDGHNTRLALLLTVIAVLSFKAMAHDAPHYDTRAHISEDAFNYINFDTPSNFETCVHQNMSGGFEWCADTGTNRFVTNDLFDYVPTSIRHIDTVVNVGNGTYTCKQQGTVLVRSSTGLTIACQNVLYMPNCGKKLMPATPFVRKGCSLTLYDNNKIRLSTADKTVLLEGKEIEGLYYFKCATIRDKSESCITRDFTRDLKTEQITRNENESSIKGVRVNCKNPDAVYYGLPVGKKISEAANDFAQRLLETHFAYGHLNFPKLRKMLGLKKGDSPHCATCAVAMSRTAPLNTMADRSTRINHRMHLDMGYTAGSTNPFQLGIDDHTRVGYIDLLTSKDEALQSWIELQGVLENQHAPWKFGFVKTDNEFVYTSNAWIAYCRDNGVEHEFSPPYRHDGLGVVERAMQTIGVCFRCMMLQGNAPASVIPYALVHANVIRNHSPTKANNGRTPLEKQAGMKLPPNERLTRGVLFCLFYVHVYDEQRVKHDPRGIPSVYLGFDDRNNQFIAMEWLSGKIRYVGDGTFHCGVFPFRANPARIPDWMNEHDRITPNSTPSDPNPDPHSLPTGPRRSLRQHGYQYTGGKPVSDVPDVDVSPEPARSLLLRADEIEENVRFHANISVDYSQSYFVHTWGKDPANWKEAMEGPFANEWIQAMLAERESFRQHNVYKLVRRSEAAGRKIFKPRPVLKIKINPPTPDEPNGSLEKFKYRLTVAAFTRMLIEGIDYKEKHSSTVRWNALKLLFARAVMEDWDLMLIDIKTFFLYGVFDDDTVVFMEQPDGWDTPDKPARDYICQLIHTLYGHPAASHEAQVILKDTATKDGKFLQTTADDCVYVSAPTTPGYAAAGTHVDDIMAVGDGLGLSTLVSTLEAKFELTTKLNPSLVTGVQIERNRKHKWLKLHQQAFIINLLTEWEMFDCTPVDTPMDPGTARALMLIEDVGVDLVVISKYQSLVGSLLWLYKTRPDLMYVTNLLARFCRIATPTHLKLATRVLRYLKGTSYYGIVFQAGFVNDGVLSAEADADLAGDLITSRSTMGSYAKYGEHGTVACNSSLDRKISTSTGQAETYALASLVKELVWIRHLCYELRFPQTGPTQTGTDNQGVHLQSTKSINHAAAKHYRISQAYIRSKGVDGTVKVVKVSTEKNHADFFTKPLCFKLFDSHRTAVMGPQLNPGE
jgi:hypothetical protein